MISRRHFKCETVVVSRSLNVKLTCIVVEKTRSLKGSRGRRWRMCSGGAVDMRRRLLWECLEFPRHLWITRTQDGAGQDSRNLPALYGDVCRRSGGYRGKRFVHFALLRLNVRLKILLPMTERYSQKMKLSSVCQTLFYQLDESVIFERNAHELTDSLNRNIWHQYIHLDIFYFNYFNLFNSN